jgi:hypothetical protein
MWCVGVEKEKLGLGRGRGRGKEEFGVWTSYEVNLLSEWKGDFTTLRDFEQKGKV